MTPTLVLTGDLDTEVIATRPSTRDRVRAWCGAGELDRALARGVCPEANVRLALRAQRLVRPRTRHQLAVSLRRIVAQSLRPTSLTTSQPYPARRRIRAAAPEIEALAAALERPAPVSSRGVALVCVLLSDGTGPLHAAATTRALADSLVAARQALS